MVPAASLRHHVPVLRRPHRHVRDPEHPTHEMPQRRHAPGVDVFPLVLFRELRRAAFVVVLGRALAHKLWKVFEFHAPDAREEGRGRGRCGHCGDLRRVRAVDRRFERARGRGSEAILMILILKQAGKGRRVLDSVEIEVKVKVKRMREDDGWVRLCS